jgi:polygalacturonase
MPSNTVQTSRRALLKLSPFAVAATAATSVGRFAIAELPTQTASEPIFSVRNFGATGDGKTVDTPAINQAIDAVFAAGGGMLVFPAGTYVCFTIHLRSNVDLYLSRGCVVLAADSPKPGEATGYNGGMYDPAGPTQAWESYQDYGHNHWNNSLFYGEGLSNFSILGPGLIHGRGLSYGQSVRVGATADPLHGPGAQFRAEQPGVGNKTIALKNCHNVILRDFSVLKGGHFAVLATGVDNLTIDNLLIDTDRDGLDIDCCRNVRVSNCTVNSPWDDAICPKSSYALGYRRATENVTIANNYVTATYELGSLIAGTWKKFAEDAPVLREGRIKCGTESNGGFRNITISGNVIEGCKGIALEASDGALLEDFAITGNTMRDIVDSPLFLCLNRRDRNPKETARPGAIRRILISDLVCHNSNASTASIFSGIPDNMIEDVKLSNCYIGHKGLPTKMLVQWGETSEPMPDWRKIVVPDKLKGYPEPLQFGPTPCHGFFLRHLRNLELSHVEISPENPDPRPAFWLEDTHRTDFFAVTSPPQPNFELRNVTDLRVGWSRAAKDTNLASAINGTL